MTSIAAINTLGTSHFPTATSPVSSRPFTATSPSPLELYGSHHDGLSYITSATSPQPSATAFGAGIPMGSVGPSLAGPPLIPAAFQNGY
nr:hypothetical protein BaRGS_025268 [Batillaria attramentaria]